MRVHVYVHVHVHELTPLLPNPQPGRYASPIPSLVDMHPPTVHLACLARIATAGSGTAMLVGAALALLSPHARSPKSASWRALAKRCDCDGDDDATAAALLSEALGCDDMMTKALALVGRRAGGEDR